MTVQRSTGRFYVHPITGEEFRSVTTILGAAAKPALDKWKTKTIASFAADNREMLATLDRDAAFELIRSSQYTSSGVAAATGEAVHARLEALFGVLRDFQESDPERATIHTLDWMEGNDEAGHLPPELRHVDLCFVELLSEFEIQPLYMENTLLNRTIGYAGSADLIAMIRPRTDRGGLRMNDTSHRPPWKRAVIDTKSGKSIYGSVSLQLVGYAKAEHILMPDGTEVPMPPIHETYALHVRPRSWALRPMRYDAGVWKHFQELVGVDQWVNFEERNAVGDAINRGAIERKRSYNARYSDGVKDAA